MEIGPFPLTSFISTQKEESTEPYKYTIYKLKSPQTDKVHIGYTTLTDWKEFFDKNYDYYNEYLNGETHHLQIYHILQYDIVILHVLEELNDLNKAKLRKNYWKEQYPTSKLCTKLPKNTKLFCVYKISSIFTDKVYIGKTINGLRGRISGHLSPFNRCTSKTIFEDVKKEHCEVEIIDQGFSNEDELHESEHFWRWYYYPKCVNVIMN